MIPLMAATTPRAKSDGLMKISYSRHRPEFHFIRRIDRLRQPAGPASRADFSLLRTWLGYYHTSMSLARWRRLERCRCRGILQRVMTFSLFSPFDARHRHTSPSISNEISICRGDHTPAAPLDTDVSPVSPASLLAQLGVYRISYRY
jgi:hypothetical protein